MKALRLSLYLTVLSVLLATAGSSIALEKTDGEALEEVRDCETTTDQMLRDIQSSPNQLSRIFEQSLLKSKHCACELLTVAIRAGDGKAGSVKALVVIALKHAGEQASAIADCAVIAAPTQLDAIRAAFAEVQPRPLLKKPSGDKAKIGTMIKKLMPGLKPKSKSNPKPEAVENPTLKLDPSAQEDAGRSSKIAFQHRPSGKEVLSDENQISGEVSAIAETGEIGAVAPLNQFEFDYLWPELRASVEEMRSTISAQWYAYAENGFDSNVNTAPGNTAVDSYFVGGGIGTYYSLVSGDTQFELRARFGARYNENVSSAIQDVVYRGRLLASLEHQISERLELTDQIGVVYDAEPDFLSGETSGFRTDQYVFGYNRLAFGYRWAKHFSTRTYYTVSTIQYEDDWLKVQEDRWRHLIGQQFRFLRNEQRAVFLEYRYGQTDFKSVANDSQSHYFIGGVDYEVSSKMKGSVAAGAERRSFERFSDQWQPYAAASFQTQWLERTQVRWGARLGFEDAEIGPFRDRYSFRSGLMINRELSDRLKASLGFFYLRSDFEAGVWGIEDYTDNAVMLQLAMSYVLRENMNLYLSYDFTTYDSGDFLKNYDRHRVRVGLNSSF